ncbi:hypothetical protein ACIO3O_07040 [Streptomyces sp. NPDC087440]|uniref:hypothetical protein n=1 Tax=Streptomyces sp. NPDC087440 TaxID=3365790 RepID=UPI0037F58E56
MSAEDGGEAVLCPACQKIVLWLDGTSRCPACNGPLPVLYPLPQPAGPPPA